MIRSFRTNVPKTSLDSELNYANITVDYDNVRRKGLMDEFKTTTRN